MRTFNNYKNQGSKCQDKQADSFEGHSQNWQQLLADLAQSLPLIKSCRWERNSFYTNYLQMCQGAARVVLCKMNWRGDLYHDSQDIASECVKGLIRQEQQANGAFSEEPRTQEQLRGYLSRTIYRSCKQRAIELIGKVTRQSKVKQRMELANNDRLEQLHREYSSQPWRRLALKEALESMSKAHRRQLPKGITPLQCVLDDALGNGLLEGKVPLRTLQRYKQQARETLANHIGIDLSIRQRQIKWESWEHHRCMAIQREQLAKQDF
jgi:hypothetical protein